MGGTPAVIPSNDWWKAAEMTIQAVTDYQLAKWKGVPAQGGPLSSNALNIPPGQQGLNPQAASTPGGKPQAAGVAPLGVEARAMVALVVGALVLVLIFTSTRR